MATIRYSALVADARGSVGGVTFSKSRSGPVTRTRYKPPQRPSDRRHMSHAILSDINYYWRQSMTDSQRSAWNDRAAETISTNVLGHKFHASGWSWFFKANSLRILSGQALVTVPPAKLRIRTPHFTIAYTAPNKIDLTDTHGWAPVEGGRVLMYEQHKVPPSINTWSGPWQIRFHAAVAWFDAVPAHLQWIDASYYGTASFFNFRWVLCTGATSLPWTIRTSIPTGG